MRPQLTDALALDCEMVSGESGKNLLAQVAICNEYGQCVYNYYVKHNYVEDYRTKITGITPNHLQSGKQYQVVRHEVADIIRGRILVGHALHNDLRVMGLGHPEWNRRDTAIYFCTERGYPSLKSLAWEHLGWDIQNGYHNALEDARTAMRIYKKYEEEWEEDDDEEDDDDDDDEEDDDEEYYYSSSDY